MKHKKLLIAATALVMISAASVGPAMAYFTDSHIATGMVAVDLGDSQLTPNETVEGMTKTITVENTGDYDVYIRVKPIVASGVTVTVNSSSSLDWEYKDSDGYYYYNPIVPAKNGDSSVDNVTGKLVFDVAGPADSDQESFNVVIIQEATKVLYNKNGTPYANWELAISSETNENNSEEGNE